ncbi:MAG: hypothetical protein LBC67_04915 [Spirochaetales bacterium]|jgi:hypothetical protein|nr:hypothetical protein [Spirochaetales bacterium]
MIAALEKTVTIGADKHITIDLSALEGVSEGEAQVVLLVLSGTGKSMRTAAADSLAGLTKSPGTSEMLAEAEKIWAYNHAHPEEVKATLKRLKGSFSPSAFGGLDGVSYQRKIRDEWEDRLAKNGAAG